MGVIIAVTIDPNGGVWGGSGFRPPGLALYGAEFVVIPERYPLRGARSSRLTVAATRNPATLAPGPWGPGSGGSGGMDPPRSGGIPGGRPPGTSPAPSWARGYPRSEERRVGKE